MPDIPAPVLAVDAGRNRSGGAITHLIGVLGAADPRTFGIQALHVWAYSKLLDALPNQPWLIKHGSPLLERSLPYQLYWQRRVLPQEMRQAGCDFLLSTDAGTIATVTPSIVMSRDMLSFEPGEMERYPRISWMYARLYALRLAQVSSLRQATGALFLTGYAADCIQRFTGPLPTVRIIPHGIGANFRQDALLPGLRGRRPEIRCLYVSNLDLYKHQWNVVRAIGRLRKEGFPVTLHLVGGGSGLPLAELERAVAEVDPDGEFVTRYDHVPHGEVARHLAGADIFIFASSCENMPNTLVEAMAAGLPIACSNRGPMPEVLGDGGVYFDPESVAGIGDAVRGLLVNEAGRETLRATAQRLSRQYTWENCASATWQFVVDVFRQARVQEHTPAPTLR